MLSKEDCDIILEALAYAELNVRESSDNQLTKHATFERIESAAQEIRELRNSLA